MNQVSKLLSLFLVLGLMFGLSSCKDEEEQTQSITEIAAGDADLSSLVAALQKVDLDATLAGNGSYTVFAPSNDAFSTFLTANGFASLDEVPDALLTSVLLNHVVAGDVRSGSLSTGYVKTLANSAADSSNKLDLYVDLASGVKLNGVSTVTNADIVANNGVIHKVDAVIGLPTLVTHAASNSMFSSLVAGLTVDGAMTDYVSVLSGAGPYTVFAPTNDAFAAFLTEKGFASLGAVPVSTLETILQYHVLSGNTNSSAITDGLSPATLEGTTFTINTTDGVTITDNENRVTNVVVTDVQANNGIIHVVDRVLSPL